VRARRKSGRKNVGRRRVSFEGSRRDLGRRDEGGRRKKEESAQRDRKSFEEAERVDTHEDLSTQSAVR